MEAIKLGWFKSLNHDSRQQVNLTYQYQNAGFILVLSFTERENNKRLFLFSGKFDLSNSKCPILADSAAFKPIVSFSSGLFHQQTASQETKFHSFFKILQNARFSPSHPDLAQHMVPGQRQVTVHQVIWLLQSVPAKRKSRYLRILTPSNRASHFRNRLSVKIS